MVCSRNKQRNFTRIFFATDAHGSEKTFLKFLKAGAFYDADIVMLCGDLTGKMVVPITRTGQGCHISKLYGQETLAKTEEELARMKEKISNAGFYPYETDQDEIDRLSADPARLEMLFKKLMLQRLESWARKAEERYRGSGLKCIMTGGNDDPIEIESILNSSDFIINSEGKVVKLDDDHEMITIGKSNITPWKCPRDVPENELKKDIEDLASKVEKMQNSVFNLHVPPIDSKIDTAAKLDNTVYPPKIVVQGGHSVEIGAGSTAVRESIEKYQPLLGLHGHIHESRGTVRIGRTVCVNPGSEYSEGILRGVIVNIRSNKLLSYQLTSG